MPPTTTSHTELSTRGVGGHALRRVQKLNNTLRQTRELVADCGEAAARSIALLLAETRVLVLHMGRHEFGRVAGMHFHAVKNAETPGTHPQHESFSRVYRTWQRLATGAHGQSPAVKRQLLQACDKLLDLLVPEQDEHGRPLNSTIDGLYRIWMYQYGHGAFDAASRKTNRQRVPLIYGTLWQRREVGMVPDYEEVRVIGTHLGCELEQAAAIWQRCKTEQLQQRGVPQPLVRFIVAIQLAYPGLRMSAASLRKHLQVSEKTAQAINSGQLVKFSEIRHVVPEVIPRNEIAALTQQWQAAWERASSAEDFSIAFPRICADNGWTNHMLASLLRVRPPELRGERAGAKSKAAKVHRAESYRPSAEVRRMYQENSFSGQAPAKAAIDLVATDAVVNPQGETQRDYLTRLFLEGVEERLLRKGSGAYGSPVRAHRILCGVMPQQLADASGYSKADLLLVERGIRQLNATQTKRILQIIETFPARKVTEAQARLAELNTPPATVRQAVARLKERQGGYIPAARLLQDEADRRLSFTPGRLKRIERGQDVPTLPLVKYLVSRGGAQVSPELVRDWYDQMPEYLARHGKLKWKHPLARGFGIVIFEKWHSLHQFWEEQMQEDFSYSMVIRNFQQMNGKGYDFPWSTISRYLNAAGVGVADPRRLFLQHVFQRKNELTTALDGNHRRGVLSILGEILPRWRKEVRAANQDPQAVEHTLGLTREEREWLSR